MERYILAMLTRDFRLAEGTAPANDERDRAPETSGFPDGAE
jgi:hypothetical protein